MAGLVYNKTLLGCCLIILLSAGMMPQSGNSSTQGDNAQPSPQASAPDQAKDQKPVPVYESATVLKSITRLVVVDVVAADHNGAVTDLQRDDFTILEDGKEQKIRVFNFQQPRKSESGTAAVVPPKLPENVYSNAARFNASSALNVVLMDALNTNLPHQAYVRDQMIRYLEKMPEGQPVAVYTLGSKLTLLQDFTNDPTVLKKIVKELKGKTSALLDNPAGGPETELLPAGLADSGMLPGQMLESMQRFEQERVAFQTDLRVRYTLNALNSIARSLSGYPGRKNLIWISEAFPISIDPNMELSDAFAGTRNYGQQIAEAADALIDAQIAMYPIDARGLEPNSMFDASNSGRDKFGRSMSRPGRLGTAISNENAQIQNAHGAMQEVADRTGGRAFYNTNAIDEAIRKSIEDGSTYYTLAYYPENKNWNGKFRKIQVKVNRSGLKLRHRMGYYAVDPTQFADQGQKRQMEAFDLALNPDSPIATGLPFNALVIPPVEKAPKTVRVNFGVDPHAISFERQADGLEHASLECTVQAFTAKGKLIKGELSTIKAALKPETFARVMEGAFPCQQAIDLEPGNYYLRLGVRDERTGLIGTTNAKVAVASAESLPAKP